MKHYDYSRGLKAPYSLQVIKSPKGKVVWVFAQPLNMSYVLMLIVLLMIGMVLWSRFTLPTIFGIDLNLLLVLYFPHKIARWYSETEPDGKSANHFLKDFFSYSKNYILDKRPIVAFERIKELEEFSFKR